MSKNAPGIDYNKLDTLDCPELGTGPVPAVPYFSPEFAQLERDKIFSKTWLFACHENQIPNCGDFIVKNIGLLNVSLIFSRAADGIVRGFHNVCTHRGNQLVMNECAGTAKNNMFVCQFHGWAFGCDGSLKDITDEVHYFNLDKAKLRLPAVAVSIWKGWIFFNLQPEPAQTLEDFIGSLAESLDGYPSEDFKLIAAWSAEVKANWKIIMDGFQEAYHEVSVHKATSPDLHTWANNPFGRHSFFRPHGLHRVITMGVNPGYKPTLTAALVGELLKNVTANAAEKDNPGLNPGRINNFHFDANGIFPNTLIIAFVGACAVMEFIPIAEGKSTLSVKFYADKNLSWSERIAWEYPVIFFREAVLEDLVILEATQRGLSSGALKHIVFSDGEIGARHLIHSVLSIVDTQD